MKANYTYASLLLIVLSVVLRIVIAGNVEFGNDEVYYWLYAKYPDISHFDHPPMVGFFIQLFTFNLTFDSELAIRLAAIIPSGISMYLVFLITKYIKDARSGFIAVLLYNINIYGLVISGTFILPDSPLVLFWLLSFYLFLQVLPKDPLKVSKTKTLLAFLFAGLAVYSKYQAVFLLLGVVLYVLFCNRNWLKNRFFYLGFIFPAFFVFLILYWNYQNDFISYKFHGDRVSLFSLNVNPLTFFREILGQVLYNNPFVFVASVLMLIAFVKNKIKVDKNIVMFFCVSAIPLVFVTIYLSLYKSTLPHWSGISYLTILPLVSVYLSKKKVEKGLLVSFGCISLLLMLALFIINKGVMLPEPKAKLEKELGKKDVFLDMYGWEQLSSKIIKTIEDKDLNGLPFISNKWYPGAHIHYYIANPNNIEMYGLGELRDVHKYYWINEVNKTSLDSVLYITDSRNYRDPNLLYSDVYSSITLECNYAIYRGDYVVKRVYLYSLVR